MNNFILNQKFLKRLVKFGKITERDVDAELGKQCGYKKCCIDYFIKLQSYGLPAGLISDIVLGASDADHVLCPKCRTINNIEPSLTRLDVQAALYSNWMNKNKLQAEDIIDHFIELRKYDYV